MSEANKTRYEMQKIVIDCINEGLTQYIGSSHGFSVMEFAQASFQKADKIALVNLIRTRQLSWNMSSYSVESSALKCTDAVIEEQSWQIHVLAKRKTSPEITDLLAEDVAQMLVVWFNGKGAEFLREQNCAPTRIASEDIIVYNDDSEIYQKRAVFTVKIQVPKELTIGETEVNTLIPKVKPV